MENDLKSEIMKKIKVLFIATEFAPGMIPFASSIINILSMDSLYEIHAIVVNSGEYTYKGKIIIPNENINYIEYPTTKVTKLLYKLYPYKIIQYIHRINKKVNPDIIHLLTGDFSLAPYLFLKKSNSKLYYTVHDLHPHETEKKSLLASLFDKYTILGNKLNRNKISNLTTCSVSQYNELKELYPKKNIVLFNFPSLVTEQIANGKEEVSELKGINDYILFFGSSDRYKGIDLLIDVYEKSSIQKQHKLVIAGKGENYQSMMSSANIIRINRFIKDEEIYNLFLKAAVIVYPYRSATMSGVLSIAYYFNKKVILSDIPFFQQYACENSFFFKNGDKSSLQESIITALATPINKENNYNKFYNPETIIQQLTKFYV